MDVDMWLHPARSAADKFILVKQTWNPDPAAFNVLGTCNVRSYKVLLNTLLPSYQPVAQDAGYGLWLRRI